MLIKARSINEYLDAVPAERRQAVSSLRKLILKNVPKGFKETFEYGMIAYVVPLKTFPEGYLGNKNVPLPFAGLASQKNYMSLYLISVYGSKQLEKWFKAEYKKSGKKLNMGKSCIRFKSLSELDLVTIGKVLRKVSVKQFIDQYKSRKKK